MANILDELLSANVDVLNIAQQIAPNGRKINDEFVALCPFHREKTPSYKINVKTGLTHCFGCGHSGDIVSDYAEIKNITLNKAKEEILMKYCAIAPTQTPKANKDNKEQLKKAQAIWNKSLVNNPILIKYLNNRKITLKTPQNIRLYLGTTRELYNNGKDIPIKAMITKIENINGELQSLHITELKEKDDKIIRVEKRFFYGLSIKGGFSLFGAIDSSIIAICEGIETALSIRQALPTLTVIASLSASLMPNTILPAEVKTVYIFIDNDEAGRIAGEKTYKRFAQNGVDVYIVSPKDENTDFNDTLNSNGVTGIIQSFGSAQKLEVKEKSQSKKFTVLGKFVPRTITKEIVSRFKIFVDKNKVLYVYNSETGLWEKNADAFIESKLASEILSEELNKIYAIREVIADIKRYKYSNKEFPKAPLNLIPFQNGVYSLDEDTLIPFDPEQHLTFKLPVNYNISSKCDKIDKFINSVVEEPQELYELVAYTLYRNYPYQKFFILYGDGGNGKTTFLNILIKLLGEHNLSSTTLDSIINNRFAPATLLNKLANISSDEKIKKIGNSAILKALTGGDFITAECKNRDPFQFKNFAKIIISTNKIPASDDSSPAFFRRVHLIKFNRKFEGKKENKSILKQLTTDEQLEGLAAKAIENLKHLQENNFTFTNETTASEIAEHYDLLSNPLKSFLETYVKYTAYTSEYIPNSEFLKAYNIFLSQNGISTKSSVELKRNMEKLGYHTKVIRINEKTKKCWISLSWIDSVAKDLMSEQQPQQPLFFNKQEEINKNYDEILF